MGEYRGLDTTRGQLFRAGGLSAKRFSQLQLDRNFKPRLIAQMKKIEAEALREAELIKGPILAALVKKDLKIHYKRAAAAKVEIDSFAKSIAKDYNGNVLTAPLKGKVRALQKIINEYSGDVRAIGDLARNTIVVDARKVANVAEFLKQKGVKVYVFDPKKDPFGYSGVNAVIETKNGILAEIQVNSPEMIFAKEPRPIAEMLLGQKVYDELVQKHGDIGGKGHVFYEKGRSLRRGSKRWLKITAESRRYYNGIR
jgi:hypothetical protein